MINFWEVVPKDIAAPVIVHLGVSFVLGSIFMDRMAESKHIPACKAGLMSDATRAQGSYLSEADRKRRVFKKIIELFPPLGEIPAVKELEELLPQTSATKPDRNFEARCECLAEAAKGEWGTKIDHMVWVATLRFYTPTGVSRFDGVMNRLDQAGQCSGKWR